MALERNRKEGTSDRTELGDISGKKNSEESPKKEGKRNEMEGTLFLQL